ncbi:MAG: hypothetical protein ACJA2D_002897, partial [Pseudohongiellaceae bacterium]
KMSLFLPETDKFDSYKGDSRGMLQRVAAEKVTGTSCFV